MKKLLPLILLGICVVLLVVVFLVFKNPGKSGSLATDESNVPEIPAAERPMVSLIPTKDGHWLKLKIEKIKVAGAATLDYELLYSLPDGRQQGVPGTVKLDGK